MKQQVYIYCSLWDW